MMTAVRALDFYNNISLGKNCNEHGCKIDGLVVVAVILSIFILFRSFNQ